MNMFSRPTPSADSPANDDLPIAQGYRSSSSSVGTGSNAYWAKLNIAKDIMGKNLHKAARAAGSMINKEEEANEEEKEEDLDAEKGAKGSSWVSMSMFDTSKKDREPQDSSLLKAASLFGKKKGGEENTKTQTTDEPKTISAHLGNAAAKFGAGAQGIAVAAGLKTQEKTMGDEITESVSEVCPKLTRTQRLYAFMGCLCVGLLLAIMGYLSFLAKKIPQFAVLYTLGNLVALSATVFWVGPASQFKLMFKDRRYIATIIYLLAMALTLFVALYDAIPPGGRRPLVFICIAIQFVALVWYELSFVPFAHMIVKRCCKKHVLGDDAEEEGM